MSEETKPLYYVSPRGAGNVIFCRLVRTKKGVRMGFAMCEVCDGVDANEVCAMLNKAEPPCTTP